MSHLRALHLARWCFLIAILGAGTQFYSACGIPPFSHPPTKSRQFVIDDKKGASKPNTGDQKIGDPKVPEVPKIPEVPTNPANASYMVGSTKVLINETGTELTPDSIKVVLSDNCNGDYYQFSGENMKCSRAPLCKTPDTRGPGGDYDRLNIENYKPNPQACMGDGQDGRANSGCRGLVPYCCYMMAATGDFTKCVGYWERLWCAKAQCDEAVSRGANDSQCGGCSCGHAFKEYCGENTPPAPLFQRLKDANRLVPAH